MSKQSSLLFLSQLIESLLERGRLVLRDGRLDLQATLDSLDAEIPEGIAELVVRQLDQLAPEIRELVESASVVGNSSCSALIVAGVDRDYGDAGNCCAKQNWDTIRISLM